MIVKMNIKWLKCASFDEDVCQFKISLLWKTCTFVHPESCQLGLLNSGHFRAFPECLCQLNDYASFPLTVFYPAVRGWRSLQHFQFVSFSLWIFFDIVHSGVLRMGCFLPSVHWPWEILCSVEYRHSFSKVSFLDPLYMLCSGKASD